MDKLKIYHSLPYPIKVLGASLHGFRLRWWRYGPETEKLVEKILERDTWSVDQWRTWQAERLAFILERAAKKVPYYRSQWQNRRAAGDKASWEILSNWPLLDKRIIRDSPQAFIADDCNIRNLYADHTGGTTGTPLSIYESREVVRLWYSMYEARIRRWHKVSIKDNWIILGGQLIVKPQQKRPPFWVMNYGLNQLYLSTFHISKENVKDYVEIINKVNPTHWVVYPSSAAHLAQLILDLRLKVSSPKVIFTNAEPLWENQKEIIQAAFCCKIIKTYGMGEIALEASECPEGNMHIWPDSGILELIDDEEKIITDDNESGQYIATGLINHDMPLIRYKVGDRGKRSITANCNCQRTLPCIGNIEGRMSDLIITPDGRKIFWMNPIFYGLPLQEAQIIQEEINRIKVLVVPVQGFSNNDKNELIERVKLRLGEDISVTIELTMNIPRGANGKFKAVISKVKS